MPTFLTEPTQAGTAAADATPARDGRIDFIRGFACVAFITAHFEAFTWLHMIFWERLGLFSGAEVFVLLSGYLTGMVHRRIFVRTDGAEVSTWRLWRRAATLYLTYVVVTVLVIIIARFTALDMTAVTTFTDHAAHVTYRLVPPRDASFGEIVHNVALLRTTPHQVQILGLYAVLLTLTPFALMLLRRGHPLVCAALSVAAWLVNSVHPTQLTGALFENAFPTLAWQLYFVLALLAGWYRVEIIAWLDRHSAMARTLWWAIAAVAVASLILAQATGNPDFPPGIRIPILPADQFKAIHDAWFQKNPAQAGRVVCSVAFTIAFYRFLGKCRPVADRVFGRLFEPLGRSSLYVFVVHVPLIALVDQFPGYFDGPIGYSPATVWLNTAVIGGVIATIWLMVRFRVLFGIIPR